MSPAAYRTLLAYLDISHEEADRLLDAEPGTSERYASDHGDGPPPDVERLLLFIRSSGADGDAIREALRREP